MEKQLKQVYSRKRSRDYFQYDWKYYQRPRVQENRKASCPNVSKKLCRITMEGFQVNWLIWIVSKYANKFT